MECSEVPWIFKSNHLFVKTTNTHYNIQKKLKWTNFRLECIAAYWIGLNELLLQIDKSALNSSNKLIIKSFFLDIASCNGVSPSVSCKLVCAPSFNRVFMTSMCSLLTAMCKAVCCFLFLEFNSNLFVLWLEYKSSITAGSLPNAAWWIARSPTLSFY